MKVWQGTARLESRKSESLSSQLSPSEHRIASRDLGNPRRQAASRVNVRSSRATRMRRTRRTIRSARMRRAWIWVRRWGLRLWRSIMGALQIRIGLWVIIRNPSNKPLYCRVYSLRAWVLAWPSREKSPVRHLGQQHVDMWRD